MNVRFWKVNCVFDVFTPLKNRKTGMVITQFAKLIKDGD